jgi:hypothetical protein
VHVPDVFIRFTYRSHWFVLAQTDGADLPSAPLPMWSADHALVALNVTEIRFDELDGNVLGYACGRSIAGLNLQTELLGTSVFAVRALPRFKASA